MLVAFIQWACCNNLKASSISAYLSSLKCLHDLLLQDSSAFISPRVKAVLKGVENAEAYKPFLSGSRKVMSLPLLKLLGHEISRSSWSDNSKRVVWTACCVAFYGSFRMGEILPLREFSFCPEDTFLWRDVRILSESHALLHIKRTKNRNKGGDFVDLFPVQLSSSCPLAALRGFKDSLLELEEDKPVFRFSSGKNLTQKEFNSTISSLLRPHLGDSCTFISGHSFRAAIPAVLAKFPKLSSSEEIMGWGRWKSEDYLSYTRLKVYQRRKIFSKIMTALSS